MIELSFLLQIPYSLTVITILLVIIVLDILQLQGFQFIFSSVPVRHYLQAVFYGTLKYEHFHEFLKQYSLKSGDTIYHFKRVKVSGTAPY